MQFENSIRSTDLARKQAYKAVYAPSLDVEWPAIPSHARQQALLATLELLEPIKAYRRTKHASRKRKPRRLPPAPAPTSSHDVALRSGKTIAIPDFVTPPVRKYEDLPVLEPPDILRHCILGINSVQQALEDSIALARATLTRDKSYRPPVHGPTPPRKKKRHVPVKQTPSEKKKRRLHVGLTHSASYAYLRQSAIRNAFSINVNRSNQAASVTTFFPDLARPSKAFLRYCATDEQKAAAGPPPGPPGSTWPENASIDNFNMAHCTLPIDLEHAVRPVIEYYDRAAMVRANTVWAKRARAKLLAKKQKDKLRTKVLTQTRTQRAKGLKVQAAKRDKAAARKVAKLRLETEVAEAEAKAKPPPARLKVVLVCRPDIEPKSLVAHLPTTVCVANGLLKRLHTAKSDMITTATNQMEHGGEEEAESGIYLVQLNAGAETQLAEALGLRTAAVVGLTVDAPLDSLLVILKQHTSPPMAAHLSSLPGEPSAFQETRVKQLKILVPANPKQARQVKKAEKQAARQATQRTPAETTARPST